MVSTDKLNQFTNLNACSYLIQSITKSRDGQVVRRCRGVLLILLKVGQGPFALGVNSGGGYLDRFSLVFFFLFFSILLSGRRPDMD